MPVKLIGKIDEFLREIKSTFLITSADLDAMLSISIPDETSEMVITKVPFIRPRGISYNPKINGLAIATYDRIITFNCVSFQDIGLNACLLREHVTGDIDIHEIMMNDEGKVFFANTAFSCIAHDTGFYSFNPYWKPRFIQDYAPRDACHLNGFATRDDAPLYACIFAETTGINGWKENLDGQIINIYTKTKVAQGLCMPHSPRLSECFDYLYYLESGKGILWRYSFKSKEHTVICDAIPGFARSISFAGERIIITTSRIRIKSESYDFLNHLPGDTCGIHVINRKTGTIESSLIFEEISEIFDLEIIPYQSINFINTGEFLKENNTYFLPERCHSPFCS